MSRFESARMYARFSLALGPYLHHSMTLEQACALVKQRLAAREDTFLRIVRRSVYGYPASPYLALLKLAGCDYGDIEALVRREGLEGALLALRKDNFYIAFEEFKGRIPIKRNGLALPANPHAFDNPFLAKHFYSESGGSTGVSTRIPHDLEQYAALAPHHMIARAAAGLLDKPFAIWRGILPDASGMNNVLYSAYYGRAPEKWFSQFKAFDAKNPKYTLASYYFLALAWLWGVPLPLPRYVAADQAVRIAQWAADTVKQSGGCLIGCTVSRALRVALAARDAGIDLTGAAFMVGGEPLTPEKARGITSSGARCFSQYAMSEAGRLGNGCALPLDVTDVHLSTDAFAFIPFEHLVEGYSISVPAFHITTLLPSAPKLMFNVEMDDFGILEERDCGCLWGQIGFTTHLRGIRSYRKLTGEGVTLVAGDILRVLEQDLPARYGGSPLDYQLLEQEDERGFTRMYLLIHPRLHIPDEQALAKTVMQALRETSAAADAARAMWVDSGTLQIRRAEPILTARGKFSSLYVQRHVPK